MKGLTSHAMAEKWALFSGDWNPIHFDLSAARRLGADRLIVHGMLALLHVKQEASAQLTQLKLLDAKTDQGRDACQHFSAFFKLPALQDSPIELDFTPKEGGVSFQLKAGGFPCVRGGLVQGDRAALSLPSGDIKLNVIESRQVRNKFQMFRELFPFAAQPWIFLDALVFADFLGDYFRDKAAQDTHVVPVQMSHRVYFDPQAIEAMFHAGTHLPELRYSLQKTESGDHPGDRFGIADLTLTARGVTLMRIEVGLLGKTISSSSPGIASGTASVAPVDVLID